MGVAEIMGAAFMVELGRSAKSYRPPLAFGRSYDPAVFELDYHQSRSFGVIADDLSFDRAACVILKADFHGSPEVASLLGVSVSV